MRQHKKRLNLAAISAIGAALSLAGAISAPAAFADDAPSRRRAAQPAARSAPAPARQAPAVRQAPARSAASATQAPSRRAAAPARPVTPPPSRSAAPAPSRPAPVASTPSVRPSSPVAPSRRVTALPARPAPNTSGPPAVVVPQRPSIGAPSAGAPTVVTPSRRRAVDFNAGRPTVSSPALPQASPQLRPQAPSARLDSATTANSRRRAYYESAAPNVIDRTPSRPTAETPQRVTPSPATNQAAPTRRARFHTPALDVPERDVRVDESFASIDNARLSRLKAYSYGGYKHRKGHSAHFGFGYKDHYGFGYGKHFKPGFNISFTFGSHHYPYYHKRYIRRGYSCYDYGFGYSYRYGGYYSSFYDYCPPVTYRDYSSFYNVTYRTYNYYPTTTYTSYTSAAPTYYRVVENYADQPHGEGWRLLASGDSRSAFRYFSQAASRNLDDGAPKIGYAIASAMIGDHRRAAWAMRRAFEVDPYSVGSIYVDEALQTQFDRLAEEYALRADQKASSDEDFMLAALSFLIQDYQLAEVAAQAAIDHGDRSQAAQNLKAMIPAEDFGYDR